MAVRHSKKSGRLPCLVVFLCLLCASLSAAAQEFEDFYLLNFHADGYRLAESVPAYQSGDQLLIDFALFLEAVEFPIKRQGSLWSGWFHSQDRQFVWRMDLGVVQVAGDHGERVDESAWRDSDEGTFVAVKTLEQWFDMELPVDLRSQVLTVHSSEPLPFQLWRERLLAQYRYRPAERTVADVIVPDQYYWATLPLVDLSTQLRTQKREGDWRGSGAVSLTMGMDLLMHSVVYAGGFSRSSDDSESTNRLTVERRSAMPDEPLFAGAHSYTVGDIFLADQNLVNVSSTGRGFSIDRYPDSRSGSLGQVTIVGDGPPGWAVELYRNGALLEFGTVGPDGRYIFPDQEVPFGENIFLAKLFGPQGQIREDRQTYWGGGTDLAKGDYDFSISHIDFDRYLLDGMPPDVQALPASYLTNFSYTQALTEDFQLGTAFTRAGLGTRERSGKFTDTDYLSLFGSMKLGPGLLVGEAVHQVEAGEAWNLEYLTGIRGHKVTIAHGAFNNYDSPATIQRDALDMVNEIAVYGLFGGDQQHAYTFRIRQRDLAAGTSDWRLFNQVSMQLGNISLSNDLDHTLRSGAGTTNGRLRVASRIRGVSVRGQLDYLLTGKRPLRQVSATINWEMSGRFNNNLTLSQRLTGDRTFFFSNLLSFRVRDYDLTLSLSSDLEDNWSVGAGFNIAFGYDGNRQQFITDSTGLATTGRATMNLFIDEDNDGYRDPGEPPVAWAKYRDQETLHDVPGVLPLTALPVAQPVLFDMKFMQLDDPFLIPRAKAYELRTHAGSDVSIDVAVVLTGDIEGHVLASDSLGARGVIVTLHDSNGREVARTRSEFDGFYSFSGVPGGRYEVRISVPDGQGELVQPLTLDPQDGYIVLEKMYIFQ